MARRLFGTLANRGRDALRCSRASALLGAGLHSPRLWHLTRHNVAWAVSVGLFMAFMPVPFQMLLAGAAALAIGCNLPVAVATVWVSNPITMAPMFYGAYRLGAWLLGDATDSAVTIVHGAALESLMQQLGSAWKPFLLGCVLAGLLSAALGHALVRLLWRLHVAKAWSRRRAARRTRTMGMDGGGN